MLNKMFVLSICLLMFGSHFSFAAPDQRECGNPDQLALVAKEVVEYELAGRRYQGGKSVCLKKSKFQFVNPKWIHGGDSALLKPKYLIPKGAPVKLTYAALSPMSSVDVKFSYETIVDGKTTQVNDQLTFVKYFGKQMRSKGCFSIWIEPEHFAMREECLTTE